jgi:hypothetical protein
MLSTHEKIIGLKISFIYSFVYYKRHNFLEVGIKCQFSSQQLAFLARDITHVTGMLVCAWNHTGNTDFMEKLRDNTNSIYEYKWGVKPETLVI